MKFTALTAGLLAYSSLASALVSLSYEPTGDDRIRIGDSIRIKWSTDGTYVCKPFLLHLLFFFRLRGQNTN
jgi:hypothetical protein